MRSFVMHDEFEQDHSRGLVSRSESQAVLDMVLQKKSRMIKLPGKRCAGYNNYVRQQNR